MINFKSASLKEVLSHKTMYYEKIDYSIVSKSWYILSKYLKLPYIIHIIGTNGKGSTGRFLAHYLQKKSYKVLHYSSPHIQKFNERIWINGKDCNDFDLNFANKKLQEYLPLNLLEKLTYFEYTTLLSLILSDGFDYLVFEAGLGGEFDATNVVPSNLSLVTTIDLDHQSFLGNTIEDIAKTKMRSADSKMIIGYQIHKEVYKIAFEVKKELKEEFGRVIEVKKVENFDLLALKKYPLFLQRNLCLVLKALEELKIEIDIKLFDDVKLFGRCQKISDNITVDVGHNPLAAESLREEFKNDKIVLIYNSYKDKDYEKVLNILKPVIKEMIILEIDDKRIVNKNNLLDICKKLNIIINTNSKIRKDENYLVFGSFLVVENFLKSLEIDER
ncbi:Mur ligase family protein [Halarcobacter sp.]|uniref:Mur ligase family protein n=1 Tax=Halarcobacter sp. TaxID=2321133 RepID=UPI0029F57995|nr:Mur ligase family protein [Halarcobacter sp.]